ncbi:MAG TPA: VWA domain-containing protein [Polyangiaceae bacterium]|jgi:hypothetical protein|nr:VWA domain-containing protein [Polyangiaceae bacterium]
MIKQIVAALCGASLLIGCGGGLKLTAIRATNNKPSNVVVYFKVQNGKDPVGGLTADSFKIYEDGDLVSQYESKQTILNPEVAASHYTLLLVDMSGSITDSGAVDTLVDAAGSFAERIEGQKQQKVAVYAFGGEEHLHGIVPFTTAGGAKAAVKSLAGYKPADPSTNLNGAIIEGLQELDKALNAAPNPLRFGTLVIFTDGSDRARRVKWDDVQKALDATPYQVFAIGLGAELQDAELDRIGKDGTAKAADKAQVVKAFDDIATRIEAQTKAYYLLSYCSPARAGKHELTVDAHAKLANGDDASGHLKDQFDATGFGVGCDPNQRPNFDITKGDALAPPPKKVEVKASVNVNAGSGGANANAGASAGTGQKSGEQFTP